jgi:hypothetical protein
MEMQPPEDDIDDFTNFSDETIHAIEITSSTLTTLIKKREYAKKKNFVRQCGLHMIPN